MVRRRLTSGSIGCDKALARKYYVAELFALSSVIIPFLCNNQSTSKPSPALSSAASLVMGAVFVDAIINRDQPERQRDVVEMAVTSIKIQSSCAWSANRIAFKRWKQRGGITFVLSLDQFEGI